MTVAEYEKCVQTLSDNLYRFALKSLRDEDQAKDIVQESFLRLWENREAVLDGKEKSYLFTIAYRLIIDQVRHIRRYTTDDTLQHRPDEGNGVTAERAKWCNATSTNCRRYSGR